MKKLISLIFVVSLGLLAIGCGSKSDDDSTVAPAAGTTPPNTKASGMAGAPESNP